MLRCGKSSRSSCIPTSSKPRTSRPFCSSTRRISQRSKNSLPTLTTSFKVANRADDVKRYAYQIELEQIQSMYEEGGIGRACAKRMRENVHLMQLDLEDNV